MVDEDELWNGLKQALEGSDCTILWRPEVRKGNVWSRILQRSWTDFWNWWDRLRSVHQRLLKNTVISWKAKCGNFLEDTQIEEKQDCGRSRTFLQIKSVQMRGSGAAESHIVHMKGNTLKSMKMELDASLISLHREMNREANTILSKANDLEVSNIGISLKTEIEKVRGADSEY